MRGLGARPGLQRGHHGLALRGGRAGRLQLRQRLGQQRAQLLAVPCARGRPASRASSRPVLEAPPPL